FKLIDQVTGRLMGVRADITPQVARIDAHRMPTDHPQRLCYIGPVVHTLPDKFAGSRNPLQIGAELYGHAGIEADAEVIALLLELLAAAEVPDVTIELGHMGLFHAVCGEAALDAERESRVLECLLMKDASGLAAELDAAGVRGAVAEHLHALIELNGDIDVLARARERLAGAAPAVMTALDEVARLAEALAAYAPRAALHLDFAELRGYRYHTGIMFAAYTPEAGRAVAWGGRYDNIGSSFGRARSATGFSTDLKTLAALSQAQRVELGRILAPAGAAENLLAAIREYRTLGYTVVQALPGQRASAADMGCQQVLVERNGAWQVDDA
ncbi:MAG: ATP phosphoribosyltransferase regulatory subunit, partial [Gammaproteobacteria bacterium]